MNPDFVNAPGEPRGEPRLPPRERILAVARDLFYRHGIRAVGVEAIAEAAGTNKMTLYRHFPSKDELVAECLRQFAAKADAMWDGIETAHPGDPRGQLAAWVAAMGAHLANVDERGCAICNAAVELPDRNHPARRVIEAFKTAQRNRLARLCAVAGAPQAELLADELFLLLEGARVSMQSMGPEGPGARFVRMAEATIADHTRRAG
jgi:AcrR family transcriptional regulator